MTTLEWTLFAIIDLLILLLIPCLGAIYIFGNAISAVLPRIPRKSLWRTIVLSCDCIAKILLKPIKKNQFKNQLHQR